MFRLDNNGMGFKEASPASEYFLGRSSQAALEKLKLRQRRMAWTLGPCLADTLDTGPIIRLLCFRIPA
jgi:hypothetical protein